MPDNNNMNFGVDLLPVTTDTYYLGNDTKRWKLYATEINGKNIAVNNVATTNDVATKIEFIRSTQTGTTASWTGDTLDTELYDGKIIVYRLGQTSASTVTLNLTFPDGTKSGAKPVYRYGATTRIGTHFASGSMIFMVYDGVNERWNCSAYYDSNSNTYVTQTASTLVNDWRAVLTTYNSAVTGADVTSGTTNISYYSQGVKIQPATGKLSATEFIGSGASLTNLNASNVTSGTLAVAYGGTGTATANANTVFAGPTSGSAAAPSFRALVAADIPSITLAKISDSGVAAGYGVTDNSSSADVTSSDTNLITARTLYYQLAKKGYTTNTGTVTSVATGVGLTGGTIQTSGTIKANLTSETQLSNAALSVTEDANRIYPVRVDKNGKLVVVVPWSNTNSGYLTATGAAGDILYWSAADTPAHLTKGSNGQFLKLASGVPSWATITTSDVSGLGTMATASTDSYIPKSAYTEGYQIMYSTGSGAYALLTANKSTTKKFLTMTGVSSSAGAAPTWSTLAAGDIPNLNWSKITSGKPTTLSGYGITDALSSSLKGANNGVAELDASGKVPSSQLPAYVDDVLEYTTADFPTTGETGIIYVNTTTNKTYRWSGTQMVEISPSLALGTTSSTAFRGDYGQSAYTHAVTNKGSAFSSGFYKITTNSEGHVTATTAVTASDIPTLTLSKISDAGAAASKGVTDNSSATAVTSTDTNLITARTLYYAGYTKNTGTVTSVQVQASGPLQSSTSTAQSASLNTTISFTNQSKNKVLAGPTTGSDAAPTFRALVLDDIPDLSSAYKTVQTAVSDPTASTTTSNTFIDSISQDTNGVITVTKKTVPVTSITDNKVLQEYKAYSGYTYWRPLMIGYSSGSAESFTPSSATNQCYTFSNLKVQPSTGTISATLFKGSGASLTSLNGSNISSGTVATTVGGTGLTSYTLGDILYASAANTLSALAGNTTTTVKYLKSVGASSAATAPVWAQIAASEISGLGTMATETASNYILKSTLSGAYDIMYSSAANTPTRLAANTTTTRKYLSMLGTGSAGAAPSWEAITYSTVGAAASSHTHGNIQNGGTLQTTDVTIGSGDKLVITDSSDSNKIARASLAFSASVSSQTQSTKFLREDGTWAAPTYTTNTNNAVTHTLGTTTKYYVTGTTSATGTTSGDTFDTGVYVTTTAGELSAVRLSYNVSGTQKAYSTYNTTDDCIDFIFV